MRKEWLWIGAAAVLLSACATTDEQQAPPAAPYNGPVVEISGVEPHYEPYNPGTLQDYKVNGDSYRIVKNPQNFSQTGLASWYGEESSGNRTAIGETFDPYALSAAHPTLPLPSYVRVTNLANGRQLVVRVNDRGPYVKGRIIDLSKAAADRLNLSNNTRVKVDFINVAPDGTLSGPGTVGTTVAKQSYALPARPNLSSGAMGTPVQQDAPGLNNNDVRAIDNSSLTNGQASAEPGSNGGLTGATPDSVQAGSSVAASSSAPVAAAAAATTGAATAASASTAGYVVQVAALSDAARAQAWQQKLSQQFGVPGSVSANGAVHRVQLGPFSDRQQALALQQRLVSEAKQQSFVTAAP
ncbi:endolytic peptidoglycan transglycosylase RlpA [Serratia rhizosphaerae]|uniref:Endolytic peptidoglycan transglycosylase RlpA n=1 Tax=Serratia rhizosphaerae TaxID=2597702 RepID=A0ABX6GJ19_9GAMM|nr:endolytic peptidoglycan transglycosylase RlpA [Serratia rhizosphaerae]QHA86267.1 endolytic peptidoglycan transglycosylase RlpA [Serratia rhizosphaerae]